jgi:hypothetical protein
MAFLIILNGLLELFIAVMIGIAIFNKKWRRVAIFAVALIAFFFVFGLLSYLKK